MNAWQKYLCNISVFLSFLCLVALPNGYTQEEQRTTAYVNVERATFRGMPLPFHVANINISQHEELKSYVKWVLWPFVNTQLSVHRDDEPLNLEYFLNYEDFFNRDWDALFSEPIFMPIEDVQQDDDLYIAWEQAVQGLFQRLQSGFLVNERVLVFEEEMLSRFMMDILRAQLQDGMYNSEILSLFRSEELFSNIPAEDLSSSVVQQELQRVNSQMVQTLENFFSQIDPPLNLPDYLNTNQHHLDGIPHFAGAVEGLKLFIDTFMVDNYRTQHYPDRFHDFIHVNPPRDVQNQTLSSLDAIYDVLNRQLRIGIRDGYCDAIFTRQYQTTFRTEMISTCYPRITQILSQLGHIIGYWLSIGLSESVALPDPLLRVFQDHIVLKMIQNVVEDLGEFGYEETLESHLVTYLQTLFAQFPNMVDREIWTPYVQHFISTLQQRYVTFSTSKQDLLDTFLSRSVSFSHYAKNPNVNMSVNVENLEDQHQSIITELQLCLAFQSGFQLDDSILHQSVNQRNSRQSTHTCFLDGSMVPNYYVCLKQNDPELFDLFVEQSKDILENTSVINTKRSCFNLTFDMDLQLQNEVVYRVQTTHELKDYEIQWQRILQRKLNAVRLDVNIDEIYSNNRTLYQHASTQFDDLMTLPPGYMSPEVLIRNFISGFLTNFGLDIRMDSLQINVPIERGFMQINQEEITQISSINLNEHSLTESNQPVYYLDHSRLNFEMPIVENEFWNFSHQRFGEEYSGQLHLVQRNQVEATDFSNALRTNPDLWRVEDAYSFLKYEPSFENTQQLREIFSNYSLEELLKIQRFVHQHASNQTDLSNLLCHPDHSLLSFALTEDSASSGALMSTISERLQSIFQQTLEVVVNQRMQNEVLDPHQRLQNEIASLSTSLIRLQSYLETLEAFKHMYQEDEAVILKLDNNEYYHVLLTWPGMLDDFYVTQGQFCEIYTPCNVGAHNVFMIAMMDQVSRITSLDFSSYEAMRESLVEYASRPHLSFAERSVLNVIVQFTSSTIQRLHALEEAIAESEASRVLLEQQTAHPE